MHNIQGNIPTCSAIADFFKEIFYNISDKHELWILSYSVVTLWQKMMISSIFRVEKDSCVPSHLLYTGFSLGSFRPWKHKWYVAPKRRFIYGSLPLREPQILHKRKLGCGPAAIQGLPAQKRQCVPTKPGHSSGKLKKTSRLGLSKENKYLERTQLFALLNYGHYEFSYYRPVNLLIASLRISFLWTCSLRHYEFRSCEPADYVTTNFASTDLWTCSLRHYEFRYYRPVNLVMSLWISHLQTCEPAHYVTTNFATTDLWTCSLRYYEFRYYRPVNLLIT
jgi:hypothetical protein